MGQVKEAVILESSQMNTDDELIEICDDFPVCYTLHTRQQIILYSCFTQLLGICPYFVLTNVYHSRLEVDI